MWLISMKQGPGLLCLWLEKSHYTLFLLKPDIDPALRAMLDSSRGEGARLWPWLSSQVVDFSVSLGYSSCDASFGAH